MITMATLIEHNYNKNPLPFPPTDFACDLSSVFKNFGSFFLLALDQFPDESSLKTFSYRSDFQGKFTKTPSMSKIKLDLDWLWNRL